MVLPCTASSVGKEKVRVTAAGGSADRSPSGTATCVTPMPTRADIVAVLTPPEKAHVLGDGACPNSLANVEVPDESLLLQVSRQARAYQGGEVDGQLRRREQFVTGGQRLSQFAHHVPAGGAAFGQ